MIFFKHEFFHFDFNTPTPSCLIYQAVLEKQSYMLIGRHDIDNLLRLDPASASLPNSLDERTRDTYASDAESTEVETELSNTLLKLRPIKQVLMSLSSSHCISENRMTS